MSKFNENYSKSALNNARKLRKNMTDCELKLWYHLRGRKLFDVKFKRQVPIGNYIVDFFCMEKKLIIELDGGQHNEEENIIKDGKRTKFFEEKGYKVLRFWNNDVNENIVGVLEVIRQNLQLPSPERGNCNN